MTRNESLESPRGARPLRDSLSFERATLSRDDERRGASFEPRSSAVGLRCLRRPGGTERRSPFQSARDSLPESRYPGGLKGRGRVREARRRKHHREHRDRGAQRAIARRRAKRGASDWRTASPASREPRDRSRPRAFEVLTSSQSSPPRTVPYAHLLSRVICSVALL